MSNEPKASKIVSVQIVFGKDEPSTLDEITASIKDVLGQLEPKRITVMDEYWLVDGKRTTRADLVTPVASAPVVEPVTVTGPKSLETAVAARTCTGGCGTVCTKTNADQSDDGTWLCHQCQIAA